MHIPLNYRTALLTLAQRYGTATNRSLARVATLAYGRGAFFEGLRAGKGCTVDTVIDVLQWFSDHWPAGAEWPNDVPRPCPKPRTDGVAA